MKQALNFALKFILFWWIQFAIARIIFFFYFIEKFPSPGVYHCLVSMLSAWRLDISAIGYLILAPVFVLLLQTFIKQNFFRLFLFIYCIIVLVLYSLMTAGDLGIYAAWGTKLNYRAIQFFLFYPKEVAASSGSSPIALLLFIASLEIAAGIFLMLRIFKLKTIFFQEKIKFRLFQSGILLFCFPVCFLMIRGGWQTLPINESSAYYSSVPILNDVAVNTAWTFMRDFTENKTPKINPYNYFSLNEAKEKKKKMFFSHGDSVIVVLNTSKPNIVFIQLESFTADVVEELGGMKNVTPFLSSLIDSSILFTNIYSSGFRTDQALVTMMSAFPAQPNVSIIWQNNKAEKLPTMTKQLSDNGYSTSYFYGGDLGFANMKAYILHNGFDKIVGEDDLEHKENFGKWGAPDEAVLNAQLKFLQKEKSPFFSYLVTSSSHEPFEVPMKTHFKGDDVSQKFINAVFYTDECLRKFFTEAKKQSWFANTLFVLCADHGHELPLHRNNIEPTKYHIPLIFAGGAVHEKFHGAKISTLGSQIDIVSTLLNQLNISSSQFEWSNNLLNKNRNQFAYYSYDDGFGIITPTDTFVWDNRAKTIYFPDYLRNKELSSSQNKILDDGKSYLQVLFQEYMNY